MNESKIFIEGTPGFKPAVLGKLTGPWLRDSSDIGTDLLSISIEDNMKLNDLQGAIGKDIITSYELQFHANLTDYHEAHSPWKYVPGGPVKMTIWTNSDSKLGGKKTTDPGDKFVSKLR